MKKLIPLLFVAASAIPAATIVCTPVNGNINSGDTTVNCSGYTAAPGVTIIGVTLEAVGSWQDSSFGFTGTSDYTFVENSADFILAALFGSASGTNNGSTGTLSVGPVAVSLTEIQAFTVNATRVVTVGSIPNNASVSVQYTVTETPEPGTMALLGSALVGLGVITRRSRK